MSIFFSFKVIISIVIFTILTIVGQVIEAGKAKDPNWRILNLLLVLVSAAQTLNGQLNAK